MSKLPLERSGMTHRFVIHAKESAFKGYVTVNKHEGQVVEIFVIMDRVGSQLRGFIDAWAIQVSKRLQSETCDLRDIVRDHLGSHFEPSGRTDTPGIRLCSSPLDYICRYLEWRFVLDRELKDAEDGLS